MAKEAPLLRLVLAAALGFLGVYVPGLLWLFRFVGSWPKTIVAGFFPFLIGDAIKAALAAAAARRLRRIAADKLDA
jgi:biotin transport system substrate-specific component